MMASLARDLQELSVHFRKAQAAYLKRLRGQEERVKSFAADGMDISNEVGARGVFFCFRLLPFAMIPVIPVIPVFSGSLIDGRGGV